MKYCKMCWTVPMADDNPSDYCYECNKKPKPKTKDDELKKMIPKELRDIFKL